MRILFFLSRFPCTSETFVITQITQLIDNGHDVRIFCYGKEEICTHADIQNYNLLKKTKRLNKAIPQNHIKRFFTIFPCIIKLLLKHGVKSLKLFNKKYGKDAKNLMLYYIADGFSNLNWMPEAIVSHFGDVGLKVTALREAGLISSNVKCTTFFHAHEICRLSQKETLSLYGPMFNPYDRLLPINSCWKDKLISAGANENHTEVFHLGIDIKRFSFNQRNFDNNCINILSVGRLCGQKGYEYALKGVSKFIETNKKPINYVIIGEGHLENKLKALAEELGLENIVTFLGARPQQDVVMEMNKADIFLLPSVKDDEGYMEGIPVALMEAMARGLICISTFHAGIPELIENGKDGFLCRERDSNQIATILNFINDSSPQELQNIAQNARNKIETEFNQSIQINHLENLLSD